MKIVCIGDSLTYGYGVRRSKIWTQIVEDKLGIEIINEGINGDTTGGMVGRFNNSVITNRPDEVFIMGGTNDLIVGADLGTVKANIMSMVHQSLNKFIKPLIGIPTKIDLDNVREDWGAFSDFERVETYLEEYKNWIISFSKTFNVKYIDFYSQIEIKKDIYTDGIHLNEEGNRLMADIFCKERKRN